MHEPPRSARIQLHSYCTGASRARRVPQSSEKGVGLTQPLTRPRDRPPSPSSSGTARVSWCPRRSTCRAGATAGPLHAESTPRREEAGAHPVLPGKPPGDTPASAACHLAVTSLWPSGPDTHNHSCLGTCHWARRGSPAWRPGARLVTDLCSQGPAPGRARAQCSCLSLEPRGAS